MARASTTSSDDKPAGRERAHSRRAEAKLTAVKIMAEHNARLEAKYANAPKVMDRQEALEHFTALARGFDMADVPSRIKAAGEVCKLEGFYAQPDLGDGMQAAMNALTGIMGEYKTHKEATPDA